MKTCTSCKITQSLTSFYPDKRNKSGYGCWCKNCWKEFRSKNQNKINAYRKRYRAENPKKWLESSLKMKYQITYDEHQHIANLQNDHCKLCPQRENLQVDHDHKTGQVRGLLCGPCNRDLGVIEKRKDSLKIFLDYLENNYANERYKRFGGAN